MSWVTVIWSICAGVSLTLGAINIAVWIQNRKAWANLLFSAAALSVAWLAAGEYLLMHARSPAEFGDLHRWIHAPLFCTIVSLVGFIHFYFRTGRLWLAWGVVGLRVVVLIVDFLSRTSFNYREITGMQPFHFLGELVSVPIGVQTPWARLGEGSGLLVLVYVLDASIRLWRRGNLDGRRRALVVGGSVGLCFSFAIVNGLLVHTGTIPAPYFISLSFIIVVVAMGYELSHDMIRAAWMANELRENAESIGLAASAAQLALWRWDIPQDTMWISPSGRRLYGIQDQGLIRIQRILGAVHPEDRATTAHAIARAQQGDGAFRAEYRVLLPDGALRWIASRGNVEFDSAHRPLRMRGVSIDFTERKEAELEAEQHRAELAHLTRVTTLSQLSGSLAHELNQPLGTILSNAQAAQRLLQKEPPDVAEVREILVDIVSEDRRAGEVIQRLRALLKRGETTLQALSLNEVITEVLHLTNADLVGRGVTLVRELAADLPTISGDRVQLQQVALNLILNAADAMSANAPGARRIHVATTSCNGEVRLSVRDEGPGLPADVEQIFAPFYTTKSHGLGMGLAICRSIIGAHQGKIWAEPNPQGGAVFFIELPNILNNQK